MPKGKRRGRRARGPEGNPREWEVQVQIADYLDQHFGGLWFHVENGELRHMSTAWQLKQEGVKRGVPDVFIMVPFELDGVHYSGLVLELKRPQRGVVSLEQKWFLAVLRNANIYALVTRGFDEAKAVIERCYPDGPVSRETTLYQCVHCYASYS